VLCSRCLVSESCGGTVSLECNVNAQRVNHMQCTQLRSLALTVLPAHSVAMRIRAQLHCAQSIQCNCNALSVLQNNCLLHASSLPEIYTHVATSCTPFLVAASNTTHPSWSTAAEHSLAAQSPTQVLATQLLLDCQVLAVLVSSAWHLQSKLLVSQLYSWREEVWREQQDPSSGRS